MRHGWHRMDVAGIGRPASAPWRSTRITWRCATPLTADDQVVAISHRGYERCPQAVLAKARAPGAWRSRLWEPMPSARTPAPPCAPARMRRLAALAGMVASVSGPQSERFAAALRAVPEALRQALAVPAPVEVARACAGSEPLLLVGFDLDAVTAYEAALKIKEGARLWAEAMSTEFALHGTPAAYRPGMNVITITPGTGDQGRMATLRALLAELGARVWTCGEADEQLPFARTDPWMRPFTSIIPLQRLTAELARLRHTDPDTPHAGAGP